MNGRHFNQLAATAAAGYNRTAAPPQQHLPPTAPGRPPLHHAPVPPPTPSRQPTTFCGKANAAVWICRAKLIKSSHVCDATTVVVTFGPPSPSPLPPPPTPIAALPLAPLQHLRVPLPSFSPFAIAFEA